MIYVMKEYLGSIRHCTVDARIKQEVVKLAKPGINKPLMPIVSEDK